MWSILQFVLSIGTLDVNETLDIDLGGLQNVDPGAAPGTLVQLPLLMIGVGTQIQGLTNANNPIPVNDPNYTDGAVDPDSTTSGINNRWFHRPFWM